MTARLVRARLGFAAYCATLLAPAAATAATGVALSAALPFGPGALLVIVAACATVFAITERACRRAEAALVTAIADAHPLND